jgi:hypothetical protein
VSKNVYRLTLGPLYASHCCVAIIELSFDNIRQQKEKMESDSFVVSDLCSSFLLVRHEQLIGVFHLNDMGFTECTSLSGCSIPLLNVFQSEFLLAYERQIIRVCVSGCYDLQDWNWLDGVSKLNHLPLFMMMLSMWLFLWDGWRIFH